MNDIQNQLQIIAQNTGKLADIANRPEHFWNTQWFSALVGATVAILITWMKDAITDRQKELFSLYKFISENTIFCSPDSLIGVAGMTMYGGTMTRDGKTTVIPEKTMSEKIVIQLRKKCKYWTCPLSKIRSLFHQYEKALNRIPEGDRLSIKASSEYQQAQEIFDQIVSLSQRKTGESQWTAR